MTRTILAFGDSNTHGTPPMHSHDFHPRLPRRWPVVLADARGYDVIEDGLPGRSACAWPWSDPDTHLDGMMGLRMSLSKHGPIDDLLIMLGTNDLQWRFGRDVPTIVAGLSALVRYALTEDVQARHDGFAITLICPPAVAEVGSFVPDFAGAATASRAMPGAIADLALRYGVGFFNADDVISVSPIDGVHFDETAHQTLGTAIAAALA